MPVRFPGALEGTKKVILSYSSGVFATSDSYKLPSSAVMNKKWSLVGPYPIAVAADTLNAYALKADSISTSWKVELDMKMVKL